jgi:DNA-binding NtrC family response regulator
MKQLEISMEKKRLLIVDDEEDLRDILAHQLKQLGAEIVLAENGRVALELVKAEKFDAVLSDISMPEMTGLEFLAGVRAFECQTPFVILTGFGDKSKAVEALRLGAFDFMEKPWDPDQLRRTINDAMELGVRMRSIEDELDAVLAGFRNISEEQRNQLRLVQRSLLMMKLHKNLMLKKV